MSEKVVLLINLDTLAASRLQRRFHQEHQGPGFSGLRSIDLLWHPERLHRKICLLAVR